LRGRNKEETNMSMIKKIGGQKKEWIDRWR
jgi:hypothetical protein